MKYIFSSIVSVTEVYCQIQEYTENISDANIKFISSALELSESYQTYISDFRRVTKEYRGCTSSVVGPITLRHDIQEKTRIQRESYAFK